jgi:muramoyltetrapeptide carboxypeptidase
MKVMPNVMEKEVASVERRAALLEQAWLDPQIDLIVFAYGGKGAEDVVERLNWEKLRARDMRVVGFSDLTMLVNAMLAKKVGHPYTGPVLTTLGYSNAAAVRRMRETMAGRPGDVKLRVVKAGEKPVKGLAMGGLLDRLHRLACKGGLPDTAGRVMFIENTNKYAPRTEEMLGEMRAKGVFDKMAAVVICDFNSKAPEEETRARLAAFAASVPCPVYAGYPYGHISNTSIIDFRRELTITPQGRLSWRQDGAQPEKKTLR